MRPLDNPYPALQELSWHRTPYYSFFLPRDWHPFTWIDGREGEIYGPCSDDPSTVFAVAIRQLPVVITEDDLEIVLEGFLHSICKLPACKIASHSQQVTGSLVQVEAKYSFEECGTTRTCWEHVVYHQTRQITFTAQGATPARYAYWKPWFCEAMATKRVHTHMTLMPLV